MVALLHLINRVDGPMCYALMGLSTQKDLGMPKTCPTMTWSLKLAIQGLARALGFINNDDSNHMHGVTLCSDSQIILGWTDGTYRFKQQNKLNKYKQLQFLVKRLDVKTRWIKSHNGDEHNERCDKLANMARKSVKEDLDKPITKGDTRIGKEKGRCS